MASSAFLKLSCAILVCIMVAAPPAEATINCGLVSQNLAPCIGFLKSSQGLTIACCNGIKTLKKLAATSQDRQTACKCMKSVATAIPGINPKNPEALPIKCGVILPGSVGPQTDCSQVK